MDHREVIFLYFFLSFSSQTGKVFIDDGRYSLSVWMMHMRKWVHRRRIHRRALLEILLPIRRI